MSFVLLAVSAPVASGRDIKGAGTTAADKCIGLTIGSPSSREEMSNDFLRAIETFDLNLVNDAFATCRAAIARDPSVPGLARAHRAAVKAMSIVLFGTKFKGGEKEGVALALANAKKAGGLTLRLLGLYLGSAYEYGHGTPKNLDEAKRWYGKAAAAGDKVSARELARLGQ